MDPADVWVPQYSVKLKAARHKCTYLEAEIEDNRLRAPECSLRRQALKASSKTPTAPDDIVLGPQSARQLLRSTTREEAKELDGIIVRYKASLRRSRSGCVAADSLVLFPFGMRRC